MEVKVPPTLDLGGAVGIGFGAFGVDAPFLADPPLRREDAFRPDCQVIGGVIFES